MKDETIVILFLVTLSTAFMTALVVIDTYEKTEMARAGLQQCLDEIVLWQKECKK